MSLKTLKLFSPLIVLAILWFIPAPEGLTPNAWHFLAIFFAVVVGLIIEPVPAALVGFSAISLVAALGLIGNEKESITWALSGFSNSVIWLIFAAFMFALGYKKTGLGRLVEGVHVLETPVDRREADVRHLVQPLEFAHHQLADVGGGDFALAAGEQRALDAGDGGVDQVDAHVALAQGQHHRRTQLGAVELDAVAVLLHHRGHGQLDPLVGGEALVAGAATAAPAHRVAFVRGACLDDRGVLVTAIGAAHRQDTAPISRGRPGSRASARRPVHARGPAPLRRSGLPARRRSGWRSGPPVLP